MYIITKNRIINSDLVASFGIVTNTRALGTAFSAYTIRAYCSARTDEDGSYDFFLINTYSTEAEARTALDRILNGLLNGEKAIDLS